MDIQAEKLDLITWLAQLNDTLVIEEIKMLKKEQQEDWWDTLSKDQQDDLEAGLEDLRMGRKKDIAEVLAKYK
jgi:uncharacterized membrane protein YgcG